MLVSFLFTQKGMVIDVVNILMVVRDERNLLSDKLNCYVTCSHGQVEILGKYQWLFTSYS